MADIKISALTASSVDRTAAVPCSMGANSYRATPSQLAAAGFGVSIVTAFGAVGDGVHDDTTAIQAALDAARAAPLASPARVLYFPAGTYKITAELRVNMGQVALIGAARYATSIVQATTNTPIFVWTDSAGGGTHSVRIESMRLSWPAPAAATDYKSYAIMAAFQSNPAGAIVGDSGGSLFYCTFRDLAVENSFIAIGSYPASGVGGAAIGSSLMWGCLVEDCWFQATRFAAIDLFAVYVAGMPANQILHVSITNQSLVNGNLGPAIRVVSATGLILDGVNIEDWTCNDAAWQKLIYSSGGSHTVVIGLRTERIQTRGNNPSMVTQGGGTMDVIGADMSFSTCESGNATAFISSYGCKMSLSGINIARDMDSGYATNPANALQLVGCNNGGTVTIGTVNYSVDPITSTVTTVESLPSTSQFGASTYGRVRSGGLPPTVDVLPPASVTYRGREFTVLGGAGVADVTSRCVLGSGGTYSWIVI